MSVFSNTVWRRVVTSLAVTSCIAFGGTYCSRTACGDHIRDLQTQAIQSGKAEWAHWGTDSSKYSNWGSHSNRLIPIYSFGMSLESVRGENSVYRSPQKIEALYGHVADGTLNQDAEYFDQTDVYRLQKQAAAAGKKRIILFVFDGMDWQTSQAAAVYRSGRVYSEGRGSGLHFLDYRGADTDFGYFVSSPHNEGTKVDVNLQTVINPGGTQRGGYAARIGGEFPWSVPLDPLYLIGKSREFRDAYTDSAPSATAMMNGTKSYNNSINVSPVGKQEETIGRWLMTQNYAAGVVTSVPISHATPAGAWSNNVHRGDYQDLTRDLLGRPSISHPEPLPGVDVLLGAGWGVTATEGNGQGTNFVKGNTYLTEADLNAIDARNGGRYEVALRTADQSGSEVLSKAAAEAARNKRGLFGFFGVKNGGGHLPYQTADGDYVPTVSAKAANGTFTSVAAEKYTKADQTENPTLADMTVAALQVLSAKSDHFWLMVEAGDVDWANHGNNIDNSIGAVLSGDAAFHAATEWVEANGGWKDTVLLLTADHGHYLVLDKPSALIKSPLADR